MCRESRVLPPGKSPCDGPAQCPGPPPLERAGADNLLRCRQPQHSAARVGSSAPPTSRRPGGQTTGQKTWWSKKWSNNGARGQLRPADLTAVTRWPKNWSNNLLRLEQGQSGPAESAGSTPAGPGRGAPIAVGAAQSGPVDWRPLRPGGPASGGSLLPKSPNSTERLGLDRGA